MVNVTLSVHICFISVIRVLFFQTFQIQYST